MSSKQAKRYEAAWHKLFYERPSWKQQLIISDPFGRNAEELAHEVALLAESDIKQILVTSGTPND